MKKEYFIPLVAFFALAGLLLYGLGKDPKIIPSPFIGQAAPEFELPTLYKKQGETISTKQMAGKVWVLNLWASWCVSCRAEHKVLSRLIEKMQVPTIGLNYKDYGTENYGDEAVAWLAQYGNPYHAIAIDSDGDAGLDWGVVGVPETFVIDKKGIVRYKFTGPVYDDAVDSILAPLITRLRQE